MSKKNNKKIIARKHAHDLTLEKAAQEKLQRQRDKAQRQKQRQQEAAAAAEAAGEVEMATEDGAPAAGGSAVKKPKVKALRLKKGMKVRGIKITNKDSKAQVLEILKAEQAAKMMDIEQPEAAAAAHKKTKKKTKKLKLAKSRSSSKTAAMEA